jgi:hypothetical protein
VNNSEHREQLEQREQPQPQPQPQTSTNPSTQPQTPKPFFFLFLFLFSAPKSIYCLKVQYLGVMAGIKTAT